MKGLMATLGIILCLSITGCSRYVEEAKQNDAFNDMMTGDELFMRGDYSDALPKYREAVSKDPQQWAAHLRIAEIDEFKHQYEDAATEYKICMAVGPHADDLANARAHFRIGKALAEADDKRGARKELNAALSYCSQSKRGGCVKMSSQIRTLLTEMSKNQDVTGETTAPFGTSRRTS